MCDNTAECTWEWKPVDVCYPLATTTDAADVTLCATFTSATCDTTKCAWGNPQDLTQVPTVLACRAEATAYARNDATEETEFVAVNTYCMTIMVKDDCYE